MSLFRNLVTGVSRRRRPQAKSQRTQLQLETLEHRDTPAVHAWTGAVSNLWSNAGNWTNGSPASDPTPTLQFPASAANLANQNDISVVGGLAVTQLQFTGGGYSITGNGLKVGVQGITAGNSITNTLNNALDLTSTAGPTTLSVGTSSNLTLGGAIAGTRGLDKNGAGTLVLTANNSYTGFVSINAGTLNVRNAGALGPGGSTLVRDGATLEVQGTFTVSGESLELGTTDNNPVGTTAHLGVVSGAPTWTGAVDVESTAAITVPARLHLIITGPITGSDAQESQAGDLLIKDGAGQLELGGSNTYTAATEVQEGSILVQNSSAFGATTAGTTVLSGASIFLKDIGIGGGETVGLAVGPEPLALNGNGVSSTGALRSLAGLNSWAGPVTLASDARVGVDSGSDLRLSGVISGGAGLTKTGPGFLTYEGTSVNTYTGTTTVNDGTLVLKKPAVGGSGGAVLGPLVIGDGVGGANADVVRLEGDEQISVAAVTINSSGLLNLNNHIDAVGPITLVGGSIATGANGLLVLSASLGSNAAATTATVSGKVQFPGSRTFTVADGAAADDLVISAVIAGNTLSSDNVTKAGAGRLVFAGNNTYIGSTIVSGGSLIVNGAQPQSPVRIDAGALLGGNGTVGAVTGVGGQLGAGSAGPGKLTIAGNLNLDAASSSSFQLNGLAAATGFDQIRVNGTITLGTSALAASLGFSSAVNDKFIIIDNDGTADAVVGTFAGLAEGATVTLNGQLFQITYHGGDGNDVVLTHINTPPAFKDRSVTARVFEGGFVTLTGTITEPDLLDTFTLEVTWGDGTPTETFTFGPDEPRTVQVFHRYLDDHRKGSDVFPIHLLWRDEHGGSNSGDLSTTVQNVAPRLRAVSVRATQPAKGRATLRGTIVDPGIRDTVRLKVRWGDGTTKTYTFHPRRGQLRLNLDHIYRKAGAYRVTLSLTDDDSGASILTRVVTLLTKSNRNT